MPDLSTRPQCVHPIALRWPAPRRAKLTIVLPAMPAPKLHAPLSHPASSRRAKAAGIGAKRGGYLRANLPAPCEPISVLDLNGIPPVWFDHVDRRGISNCSNTAFGQRTIFVAVNA